MGRKKKANGNGDTAAKPAGKKQPELDGFGRPTVPAVDEAAAAYVEARDERMSLTEHEIDARLKLEALMRMHELEKYRYADGENEYEVYTTNPSVKVRKLRGEAAPQAEAE